MQTREWMNNNSAIMTLGAVVLLVVALVVMINTISGGGGAGTVNALYFYDLQSGELFEAPVESKAPIDAPSGANNGVRARVFACGECTSSDRTPAYLEKYTDQAKAAIQAGNADATANPNAMLIRAVDGDQWVPSASQAGSEIVSQAIQRLGCNAENRPRECFP